MRVGRLALVLLAACGASNAGNSAGSDAGAIDADAATTPIADGGAVDASPPVMLDANPPSSSSRGFPVSGPWVSFYGPAGKLDLPALAGAFRIFNIDADPDTANFTDAQIQTLRAAGANRVISYMNVGACESFRTYYAHAPPGHASCESSGALTTTYSAEYPDEKWANLSNVAYRDLVVHYVAARLMARHVDGFFLDNLEVIEHGATASAGPCDAACAQGGLDLVWELRQAYPDALIVMQNATGAVTQSGTTHGVPYGSLLDGISHEEVYSSGGDPQALAEMKAWKQMGLTVNGRPFWLAVEEYVGACSSANKAAAAQLFATAQADGFSPYVTDASGTQTAPCVWSAL